MKTKIGLCLLLLLAPVFLTSAEAGTKEELIRLQSEILALQKQLLDFDKSYTERLDGLRSLIEQLTDEVAKSNNTLNRVGPALASLTEDTRTTDQTRRDDLQVLTQKLDDATIAISAMAQQINDIKVQSDAREAASSLSPEVMYNQAYQDFVQGNYELAIAGFTDYIETYPGGEKAANALLFLGSTHSSQNNLQAGIDAFTRVINEYPQTSVVPTALYRRAQNELALQDKENAIADLKDILERFPTALEADRARIDLQQIGALKPAAKAKATAKTKTPARRTPVRE